MNKCQYQGKVISNTKITSCIYHLCIDCSQVIKKVKPGQFVHVRVGEGLDPFFRRPFSVFRASKNLEILYEVVGPGTKILSLKGRGDILDIIGPLGNSFSLPSKHIKKVVMIAGGIGVAPFLAFSDFLKSRKDCEMVLLYGGRNKEHTFSMKVFKDNGCKVFVATDDGSVGVKGRVSSLYDKIQPNGQMTQIYTCGPKSMMRSVQEYAKKHKISGEASCEEVMACGVGVCLGCAIKVANGMKMVCSDGPVFDLQEVVF